jgi:hypothetical protein
LLLKDESAVIAGNLTLKNSSRLEEKIARNLMRSIKGTSGLDAC